MPGLLLTNKDAVHLDLIAATGVEGVSNSENPSCGRSDGSGDELTTRSAYGVARRGQIVHFEAQPGAGAIRAAVRCAGHRRLAGRPSGPPELTTRERSANSSSDY